MRSNIKIGIRVGLAVFGALYNLAAPAQMGHSHFEDEDVLAHALVDRLEVQSGDGGNAKAWDAQAWIGGDYHKLWIKSQGAAEDGRVSDADAELLYARAFTAFWDVQAGVRRDFRPGPTQDWLAVGMQGLMPYWFNIEATAYLGESGCTAARLKGFYELLFTQRLILEPQIEANLYGQDDDERGIGSGLSDLRFGLRLRYELKRELAPYIGVERAQRYGGTADATRTMGKPVAETRWVAGLRLWY